MENDFFELYEEKGFLAIEIGHNQTADWCLQIQDRKVSKHNNIINLQDCDRKKLFAKAYCELTDYLSENYGGY